MNVLYIVITEDSRKEVFIHRYYRKSRIVDSFLSKGPVFRDINCRVERLVAGLVFM